MKGLYKTLPPFAPDYSGVCSVLFNLGGLVVIHDAGGCTGNFTGYDEPRWFGNSSAVFSSELREIDAVIGDDEKLLHKIEDAVSLLNRSFIAVLGSPSPMVMGTDYAALADSLSKKTGLPALAFDTNGIEYYDKGAGAAFLELTKRFVKSPSIMRENCENHINIIGATPLDIGSERHIQKLVSLLSKAGCNRVSCWGMGSTLEEIEDAASANLNIVVSLSGIGAANYLYQSYNVPYLIGIPIGERPAQNFLERVRTFLNFNYDYKLPLDIKESSLNTQNVLVIGEQVMSNSIRNCLRMDMGMSEINTASFFDMSNSLMEEDDVRLRDEDDLAVLINDSKYDFIIGDPLYKEFLKKSNVVFIEFPHIAVSSRLYWDNNIEYIGEDGKSFFQKELEMNFHSF